MKDIHLNLVGCGGVGLKIARELQNYKPNILSIGLWDSDTIEDRNLQRQIFTKEQVGMTKSQATADLFFPNADVLGDLTESNLWDNGYLSEPWEPNTVWIMSTDNVESRLLLLKTMDEYASDCSLMLSAANATADDGLGIGSTAWVYKKKFEGSKKDPRVSTNLQSEDDINIGRPCTETSEPQTGLANSGAAIRCVELLVQYTHEKIDEFEEHLSVSHSLFWKQANGHTT